jgi:hypothetical protein
VTTEPRQDVLTTMKVGPCDDDWLGVAYMWKEARGNARATRRVELPVRRNLLLLGLMACHAGKSAAAPSADPPPSGTYAITSSILTDGCGATPEPERQTFVTVRAHSGRVQARLPIAASAEPELADVAPRINIDFGRPLSLVDAPAPRCPAARRTREIRVGSAPRATSRPGFDVEVTEVWSIPEAVSRDVCELPDEGPHSSCKTTRRLEFRVEGACNAPCKVEMDACLCPSH